MGQEDVEVVDDWKKWDQDRQFADGYDEDATTCRCGELGRGWLCINRLGPDHVLVSHEHVWLCKACATQDARVLAIKLEVITRGV